MDNETFADAREAYGFGLMISIIFKRKGMLLLFRAPGVRLRTQLRVSG